jgi:uncharacterized membrane protein
MNIPRVLKKPADSVHLNSVYALGAKEPLSPEGFRRALHLSGLVPTRDEACRITDRLLLVFGVALVLLGLIFAVAYNWDYLNLLLGSWGKFIAMQALVIAAFAFAMMRGVDSSLGRVALVAAIVLIGPLLALFGQTYQTGADTFTLFLTWSGLALAWVLASRNAAAWLIWIVILQTALVAYTFSNLGLLGLLFGWFTGWQIVALANAAILLLWELAALRFDWMRRGASFSATQAPRLIAWVLLAILTVVVCMWIVLLGEVQKSPDAEHQQLGLGVLVWLLTMGLGYWIYRPRRELFMLTAGLVSLLFVVLNSIRRAFSAGGIEAGLVFFPIMAAVVFFYTSWARRWLQTVAKGPAARLEARAP